MPDLAPDVRSNLRPLRLQAMMTQEELAFKAGIGTRTIRDIESGKVRPQPKTLRLIAAALGLESGEQALLTGAPDHIETVPRELPRALAAFAGREGHLDALVAAVDDGATVVAVHGMAGVGKTSLAVRVAHVLAPRYPDGQLFVDLHGFTHTVGPRQDLESVLTRVLRGLDLADRTLPADIDELTARYRSILADRRVLVVLDNAASAEQVEALLPGTPDGLVLATSRRDLSSLAGSYSVPLEPPPIREAVAMIGAAAAGRTTVTEAVAIAERCGRLPLAMGLAAARLRSRPLWGAADLLERLADEDRLLDELDMGHRGVAAALRASYLELDADHQRLLRRLSLIPGDEADVQAAAALCETGEEQASAMLESLVDVHLAETRSPGRYRLHDLVRLFASRLAAKEDTAAELEAATGRLVGAYLHFAYQAAARLHPNKRRFTEGAAAHGTDLPGFADQPDALAWFQTERSNLEAAVVAAAHDGRLEQAWHLAAAFNAFFVHDPDVGPHATVNRIALDIARRTGDARKEAFTLGDAGRQLLAAGRHREAIDLLERSVALKRDLGEFSDAALTLANIGVLHRRSGRFAESVAMHEAALAQAEEAADEAAAALIRTNTVVPLLRLGRFDEAERLLSAAERRLDAGDEHNRIRIEVFRGVLVREGGDPARAVDMHVASLKAYRGEGVKADVTATLIELGEDLLRLGRYDEAAGHLDRAVEHAVKLVDPSLERSARNDLGRALTAAGSIEEAIDQHERAAALASSTEDAYELARAHHGLAEAYREKGDMPTALEHLRRAAGGYASCEVPEAAAVAEQLRALST
ncbi:ATP-binding protein [Glycomyces harbinensis]|uniref:Predicted ATPase n=1 Tax=Glycomyces harbinensis TaxID=58114 RepID=A0A1G6QPZ7_9ACTN|nr:tetratricopeptide repeat protein [Glycomyces harbinensis]SDC94408.1 Predicted ATPase [Glycomyces harbinensis]